MPRPADALTAATRQAVPTTAGLCILCAQLARRRQRGPPGEQDVRFAEWPPPGRGRIALDEIAPGAAIDVGQIFSALNPD